MEPVRTRRTPGRDARPGCVRTADWRRWVVVIGVLLGLVRTRSVRCCPYVERAGRVSTRPPVGRRGPPGAVARGARNQRPVDSGGAGASSGQEAGPPRVA